MFEPPDAKRGRTLIPQINTEAPSAPSNAKTGDMYFKENAKVTLPPEEKIVAAKPIMNPNFNVYTGVNPTLASSWSAHEKYGANHKYTYKGDKNMDHQVKNPGNVYFRVKNEAHVENEMKKGESFAKKTSSSQTNFASSFFSQISATMDNFKQNVRDSTQDSRSARRIREEQERSSENLAAATNWKMFAVIVMVIAGAGAFYYYKNYEMPKFITSLYQ
jgi:hypothetical protein